MGLVLSLWQLLILRTGRRLNRVRVLIRADHSAKLSDPGLPDRDLSRREIENVGVPQQLRSDQTFAYRRNCLPPTGRENGASGGGQCESCLDLVQPFDRAGLNRRDSPNNFESSPERVLDQSP